VGNGERFFEGEMKGKGTYFVESKHLTCHLSAIVEGDAHSVVDQVLHLALFVRHVGCGALESVFRVCLSLFSSSGADFPGAFNCNEWCIRDSHTVS
jgi:hypothetical protein